MPTKERVLRFVKNIGNTKISRMSPLITSASAVINEIDKANAAQKNNKTKKEYDGFNINDTLLKLKKDTKIGNSAGTLLDNAYKDNTDVNRTHLDNMSKYWTKLDNATKGMTDYSPYTEGGIMLGGKEYKKIHDNQREFYIDEDTNNIISPYFITQELTKDLQNKVDYDAINNLYDDIINGR